MFCAILTILQCSLFSCFLGFSLGTDRTGGFRKQTSTAMLLTHTWSSFTLRVKQGQVSLNAFGQVVLDGIVPWGTVLCTNPRPSLLLYSGSPSGHAMGSSCVWYVMITSALNFTRPCSAVTSVQSLQRYGGFCVKDTLCDF